MQAFFSLCLSVFNMVFKGFIVKTFWAWFMLSLFPNLPRIETVGGIGLCLLFYAVYPWKSFSTLDMVNATNAKKDHPQMHKLTALLNGVAHALGGAALLGSGWIFHHFFM